MRDYTKQHKNIRLRYRQLYVGPSTAEASGIITKYSISDKDHDYFFGEIIQKYTGQIVEKLGHDIHERTWLYDWTIGPVRIVGATPSMDKAIDVLLELIERRTEDNGNV